MKLAIIPGYIRNPRLKDFKKPPKSDAELIPVRTNLIDLVWTDQPSRPVSPIVLNDIRWVSRPAKTSRSRADVEKNGTDAAVLTLPDPVAWLQCSRQRCGHTPLALSYAILHRWVGGLFVDQRKLVPGLIETLGNEIAIQPMDDFEEIIRTSAPPVRRSAPTRPPRRPMSLISCQGRKSSVRKTPAPCQKQSRTKRRSTGHAPLTSAMGSPSRDICTGFPKRHQRAA